MKEHVTEWLGAYYDGELRRRRLKQVEGHLTQCGACRRELENLQRLGRLLREHPGAETLTPPQRFVAQVGLRLPRRPDRSPGQRALETGWQLVPAVLLGGLAFVQALFIVTAVVLLGLRLGLGRDLVPSVFAPSQGATWLGELVTLSEPSVSEFGRIMIDLLRAGGPLGWGPTLYVVVLVVIGLLYWSWLASWWARRRQQGLGVGENAG